jgi:hypothetical protein
MAAVEKVTLEQVAQMAAQVKLHSSFILKGVEQ